MTSDLQEKSLKSWSFNLSGPWVSIEQRNLNYSVSDMRIKYLRIFEKNGQVASFQKPNLVEEKYTAITLPTCEH